MSALRRFIDFHPVRFLSAVLAFGAAVLTGLAYAFNWSGEATGLISGGWSAFIAMIGTLFTAEQVVSNPKVQQRVHDTILALAPFAPVVSSPLLVEDVVVDTATAPVEAAVVPVPSSAPVETETDSVIGSEAGNVPN